MDLKNWAAAACNLESTKRGRGADEGKKGGNASPSRAPSSSFSDAHFREKVTAAEELVVLALQDANMAKRATLSG